MSEQKNTILLAVLGVAAVLYMRRPSAAVQAAQNTSVKAGSTTATQNVNNQMWSTLLGIGWSALRDNQNGVGSLFGKNALGQFVTSDGKPIGEDLENALPLTTTGYAPTDLDYGSTPNFIDGLFPELSNLSWQ
jgi:hypothetical protein